MLLVKLGGSVVTEKTHLRTPRSAAIRRLAGELASLREPLLIVHGAGSYGHILARRHRLNEGGPTLPRRLAAAAVQADVRELDGLVVRALNRAGLAGVSQGLHGKHRMQCPTHVRDRGTCGRMSHRQR